MLRRGRSLRIAVKPLPTSVPWTLTLFREVSLQRTYQENTRLPCLRHGDCPLFLGIEGREGERKGVGLALVAVEGCNLAFLAQQPCPPTQRRGWQGGDSRCREESASTILGAHLLPGQVGRKKPALCTPCSWQAWKRVEWVGVGLATVLSSPGQPGFVSSP